MASEEKKSSFNIKQSLRMLQDYTMRYQITIVALIVLVVSGFVILRVNSLSEVSLNNEKIEQDSAEAKPINFSEDAINEISELESTSFIIESQFVDGRDNPFAE